MSPGIGEASFTLDRCSAHEASFEYSEEQKETTARKGRCERKTRDTRRDVCSSNVSIAYRVTFSPIWPDYCFGFRANRGYVYRKLRCTPVETYVCTRAYTRERVRQETLGEMPVHRMYRSRTESFFLLFISKRCFYTTRHT